MKIVLLVSSMHGGGAERVAATLTGAWADRGDAVTLLATYSGRGECRYALHPGVEFLYLADCAKGLVGGRASYPRRLLRLRRLIEDRKPDVVVSFLANVNIAAILSTWRLGIPLIVCERTDPHASTDYGYLFRVLSRVLYPWADLVTLQTEAAAADYRAHHPRLRRVAVIPNPVPGELLQIDLAPAAGESRRRIVAMGRLAPEKQFDQLIEVFRSMAPRFPQVDLWIWGGGPLHAALERQIESAGLQGRVRLPGRTDMPWMELSMAEVFVLTSAYEGFPNVLLEAMALGLPCVAYDCPSGPREIAEGGLAAVLVRPNDRTALEAAIAGLLDSPDERLALGRRAAASVRARYGLEAIVAQWDSLIASVR